MSEVNKSTVLFCPTDEDGFGAPFQDQFRKALSQLAGGLNLNSAAPWALKIPFDAPGKANAVSSELIQAAGEGLSAVEIPVGPSFENLSITTEGLDTAQGLKKRAEKLNLPAFRVGDDPAMPSGEILLLREECSLPSVDLCAVASEAGGMLLLNAVRPHPFLGMGGALFSLGVGILDRATKLRLHRDVKPTVDTPLCAGCGSCLAACIFDAISISSGRAMIDHKLCTGCGECMNACHLGGIGPENGANIPRFQKMVAEAAFAVARKSTAGGNGSLLYVNFLTPLSSQTGGSFGRDRSLKRSFGALLSTDPVALDQATWDLLVKGAVHGLRQWSGFMIEPTPLMERATALGIGRRQYELTTSV